MLTLGISTSSGQFAIVLGDDRKMIFNSEEYHLAEQKDISVLINKCLEISGKTIFDVNNIIVDIGPGGTSRVRTGIAFANSLSYSLGIKVCPVSSMELAGINAWEKYSLPVIATVKSINGNAYVGFFNNNTLISTEYGKIENLIPSLIGDCQELVVVGYHRELIISLFPEIKIIDSGMFYGDVKIFAEQALRFINRGILFPEIAFAVTEKSS
jgi:tRNA A37 threonylcarbamoyladenosine modification protein TsaB